MPTILKIYSNMQSNYMLKNALEFTCQQFYLMHRIPFVLQLFGSVAPILDSVGEKTNQIDTNKVQSSALFSLLEAMEKSLVDTTRILELVKVNNDALSPSSTSSSSGAHATTSAGASAGAAGAHPTPGGGGVGHPGGEGPGGVSAGLQAGPAGLLQASAPYLNPPIGQFSSPASLLTAAGSSSAVLAVSGIQATNLLITSSGALGFNQVASLTAVAAANSGLATLDPAAIALGGLDPLAAGPGSASAGGSAGAGAAGNPFVSQFNLASSKTTNLLDQQTQLRNAAAIRALDFCYDDQTVRFSIIDSINLCVTVVAYATHTFR